MGWTVTTDLYSALGDSLTSVTLAWFMDLGLEKEAPFRAQVRRLISLQKANMMRLWSDHFGNLRPCNVWRLPGWADLIVERRLNLHHMNLLKYERENSLDSPSVSSLHIRPSRQTSLQEGYRKIYQNFFLFLAIET